MGEWAQGIIAAACFYVPTAYLTGNAARTLWRKEVTAFPVLPRVLSKGRVTRRQKVGGYSAIALALVIQAVAITLLFTVPIVAYQVPTLIQLCAVLVWLRRLALTPAMSHIDCS